MQNLKKEVKLEEKRQRKEGLTKEKKETFPYPLGFVEKKETFPYPLGFVDGKERFPLVDGKERFPLVDGYMGGKRRISKREVHEKEKDKYKKR